ncbi:MAG: hypothetical protein WCH11_02115 [Bdellovibrio sp.]
MKLSSIYPILFSLGRIFILLIHEAVLAHGGAGASLVGPDKGVIAVGSESRFKIHEKARQFLKIESRGLDSRVQEHWIEEESLLRIGADLGVYLQRDGWIQKIKVEKIGTSKSKQVRVRITGLKEGDQLLVTGVAFVRSAEIDAFTLAEDDDE